MSADIFISYRRQGASFFASRLRDRLEQSFPGRVFLDVTDIRGGAEFPSQLSTTVRGARVLIAVISPGWESDVTGATRLGRDDDFVTSEIATALEAGLAIVPVLIEGSAMPTVAALPAPLRKLAERSALTITHERFDSDVTHLVNAIYGHLGITPPGRLERIVELAGGKSLFTERTRDQCALAAALATLLAVASLGLWLVTTKADPLEGMPVLLLCALGLLLGLLGRHSLARRRLAWGALSISAISMLAYAGIGGWRAASMPMEPWMQSAQIASVYWRQAQLPDDQVLWSTRQPFQTPPPSVTCECFTMTEGPAESLPFAANAHFRFRNQCAGAVSFVLARHGTAELARYYPWFASSGRDFAVIMLAPSQSVRVSAGGAHGITVQPWTCNRTAPPIPN